MAVAANDAKTASAAQLNLVEKAAADRVQAAHRTAELAQQDLRKLALERKGLEVKFAELNVAMQAIETAQVRPLTFSSSLCVPFIIII